MKIDITKSEASNMADFIEDNLFEMIRNDEAVDGFSWLCDMLRVYDKLRDLENKENE